MALPPALQQYGQVQTYYTTLPQVTSKLDGKTYYRLPNSNYVYDPSRGSNGTITYLPEDALEQKKKANDIVNPQPGTGDKVMGAVAPIVGTGVGVWGANKLYNSISDAGSSTAGAIGNTTAQSTGSLGTQVANNLAPQANQSLSGVMASNPSYSMSQAGSSGAPTIYGAERVSQSTAPTGVQVTRVPQGTDVLNPDGTVTDSTTGVQIGRWAQGVGGGIQVIQGVQDFKRGDSIGGGLNTAAGLGNIGMAAGAFQAGGSMASTVVPGLNIATGLYTGYKTAEAMGDMAAGSGRNKAGAMGGAATGAAIGTAIAPGIGTAIGAGIGALTGLTASLTGSGKDKYQTLRDGVRDYDQQRGILNDKWQGSLADGSMYDFGKDGKKYGKLNTEDPNWQQAAALGNVLTAGEGGYGKMLDASSTMYSNASMSNANGDANAVLNNMKHFASQRGMTAESVQSNLDKLKADGKITDEQYNVFTADKNKIFDANYKPAPVATPQPQQTQARGPQPLPEGAGILSIQNNPTQSSPIFGNQQQGMGILGIPTQQKPMATPRPWLGGGNAPAVDKDIRKQVGGIKWQ